MSRLTDEQATKFGHAVHAAMDGREWDSDTFDLIASLAAHIGAEFHDENTPIDVWLMIPEFEEDGVTPNEEASHEANVFHDDGRYRLDWECTAVGLVSSLYFDTYAEACAQLEKDGYQDFTVNDGQYATP